MEFSWQYQLTFDLGSTESLPSNDAVWKKLNTKHKNSGGAVIDNDGTLTLNTRRLHHSLTHSLTPHSRIQQQNSVSLIPC